jgi:hypothetical protein
VEGWVMEFRPGEAQAQEPTHISMGNSVAVCILALPRR